MRLLLLVNYIKRQKFSNEIILWTTRTTCRLVRSHTIALDANSSMRCENRSEAKTITLWSTCLVIGLAQNKTSLAVFHAVKPEISPQYDTAFANTVILLSPALTSAQTSRETGRASISFWSGRDIWTETLRHASQSHSSNEFSLRLKCNISFGWLTSHSQIL